MLRGNKEAKEDKVTDAEEGTTIEDGQSESGRIIEDRADKESMHQTPD